MEEEIDIYADLPNFNTEDNESLAEQNKKISEKCTKLENQVIELTQSLDSIKKINNNLEVNLSSLLKTAKAEIARKDKMIADIRRQLDNMQFRRGEYNKSSKPTHRSPSRRKRGNSPEERTQVVEVLKVPDVTEFVCDNPPPINNTKDKNTVDKSHQLNGIVSTVFGERLRKRILDEQEEERKQKEQTKARSEPDVKKIAASNTSNQISNSGSKTDSLKLDDKVSDSRSKNKQSNLGSNNNPNPRDDNSLSTRNHSDRKRQYEDHEELAGSKKKLKIDNGSRRYRDNSRHSDRGGHSNFKNSIKSKSDERSAAEIVASEDGNKYEIVDEYLAPVERDPENKNQNVGNEIIQDRHNRVAIRLMLLAEGIDPDLEIKKSAENDQIKMFDDKKQIRKNIESTSRSRSKSKNRRHNYKSRSKTPDKHWKTRRRSKQRDDRSRRSKDRFERRRESKNKDGDNLSEFSREIYDLKEQIEHRVDDRSTDRVRKGKSLNRHKRNDGRVYRNGRSRTPDSSRSGSKERTLHRSRVDKQSQRLRSRKRYETRNGGQCYSTVEDISEEHPKSDVGTTEKNETLKVKSTEISSQVTDNLDTKSLQSLEDGEIVDSAISSPVKIIDPTEILTAKSSPTSCKINFLDSNKLASEINEVKSSLPLREIGNNLEKPAVPIVETSTDLIESMNSSKDERIENIAEFIANFNTVSSECNKNEQSDVKMIYNNVSDEIRTDVVPLEEKTTEEKVPQITNTTSQIPTEDCPLTLSSVENSNIISVKNMNGNNGDDHWCLIALDSPVKNFEENRKTRMMAQNVLTSEHSEPPNILSTDEPLLKDLIDESQVNTNSENVKIVSEIVSKPTIQSIKNNSKTKPAVLKSLRSTYHKGGKEMILSDTNSEKCSKSTEPHLMISSTRRVSDESETTQQSERVDVPSESKNIEQRRSKSPVLIDVDRNSNSSQIADEKKRADDLFGDLNDLDNVANDEETGADDRSNITSSKTVDPVAVNRRSEEPYKDNVKSKGNNIKTRIETTPKIGVNSKSELRNSPVKESKVNPSKTDAVKNVGTKMKAVLKVEKIDENNESDINKRSENDNKPAKILSKIKVDVSNSKQKKEPKKLIVFAVRRKPVHLEDSPTSSSIVISSHSVNSSEKISDNNVEPLNSLDINCETKFGQGENQAQKKKNTSQNDSEIEEPKY